jgi:hypothetical protein
MGVNDTLRFLRIAQFRYNPAEGELIAVICQPDAKKQPVFIEYKIPEATPIDEAAASFVPPEAVAAAGSSFHGWLALLPLTSVIPFIPTGPNPPPDPPPPSSTPVPEPSSLFLLVSGMAGILISRTVGKRIKKLRRQLQKGGLWRKSSALGVRGRPSGVVP